MMEMTAGSLIAIATTAFENKFNSETEAVTYAPGRVNLMGEHTDYNGGLVLPMPLNLGTAMAVGRGVEPGILTIASDNFEHEARRAIDEPANGDWSDYVLGSFSAVAFEQVRESGLRVMITSNLPVGSGLSSSAAIEVAALRASAAFFGTETRPVETAMIARAVENDFIGVPCGVMDQFAVSVGDPGHALFLDTSTMQHHPARLPVGYSFLVIHSGVGHKLTDNGYATRVAECTSAAELLKVSTLSELTEADLDRIDGLADPFNRRARHIVTENQRVLAGLRAFSNDNAAEFGELMNLSHASQRDDYDVSVPQIDELVDGLVGAGAIGARLTGGGFGGSVVALGVDDMIEEIEQEVARKFPDARVLAKT